jgi:hypothetical protein
VSWQRFKSFDEARRALWVAPGDPALGSRIRSLWAFSARLAPGAMPRGVRRFRTLEEAQAEREHWERERVARLRQSRSS